MVLRLLGLNVVWFWHDQILWLAQYFVNLVVQIL